MEKISPKIIYNYLDSRVIGQTEVKKALSAAGFLHISKSLQLYLSPDDSEVLAPTSNVLIMGPSGCGKTYSIKTLAKCLRLPLLEIDANAISKEGYKGTSINDYIIDFYENNYDKYPRYAMDCAIIFIDEFDKICLSSAAAGGWGLEIQSSLLKVIEGAAFDGLRAQDPKSKGKEVIVDMKTDHMLFILGGNFKHVREERAKRMRPLGFNDNSASKSPLSYQEELTKSGALTEIIGRVSLVAETRGLTRKEMKKTLKNCKGSLLNRYKNLYSEIYDQELEISNYHIDQIVDNCMKKKIGARGLQAALDEYLLKQDIFSQTINFDDYDFSKGNR